MPSPSDFKALADRLVNGVFSEFKKPAIMSRSHSFDYETQTVWTDEQTLGMIRTEFSERQIDGQKIKTGDYKLIGSFSDLQFQPSPDNTELLFNGESLSVIDWGKDAADASFWIHVRRK